MHAKKLINFLGVPLQHSVRRLGLGGEGEESERGEESASGGSHVLGGLDRSRSGRGGEF